MIAHLAFMAMRLSVSKNVVKGGMSPKKITGQLFEVIDATCEATRVALALGTVDPQDGQHRTLSLSRSSFRI